MEGDHISASNNDEEKAAAEAAEAAAAAEEEEEEEEEISYLKTHTILPNWLDDFIFKQLKAQYAPDYQRYDSNLDLTKEENRVYLGTYFPRSYAESFCIFENIFQQDTYKKNKISEGILNILSVGCGTGGDLMGLLISLDKYQIGQEIHIRAIDGNSDALHILSRIIGKFQSITNKKITLTTIRQDLQNLQNLDAMTVDMDFPKFDFILSFKMLNEITSGNNIYYDFGKIGLPLLTHDGLCVLLDITTKHKREDRYLPIIKNEQLNKLLKEKANEFKTLLPLSCGKFECTCTENCFTQQKFYVSHTQKKNDVSKVTYRIMGRKAFVNKLLKKQNNFLYVLQRNCSDIISFCPMSEGEKSEDAYTIT